MLRILLVDDHVLFRKGVSALLAAHQDIQVVGEAGDGLEAIEIARETLPDIILMDINMPALRWVAGYPAHQTGDAPCHNRYPDRIRG